ITPILSGGGADRADAAALPLGEAAQPLEHVARPADILAELAVADDVDADLGLLAHHICDRGAQTLLIGGGINSFPVLLLEERCRQFGRTDKAAHVCRQNTVSGHEVSSFGGSCYYGVQYHELRRRGTGFGSTGTPVGASGPAAGSGAEIGAGAGVWILYDVLQSPLHQRVRKARRRLVSTRRPRKGLQHLCGPAVLVPGVLLFVDAGRQFRSGMETGKIQLRRLPAAERDSPANRGRPEFPQRLDQAAL